NLCHDMHDCAVSVGNSYLTKLVPQILNSTTFRTGSSALFITFDEGCTCTAYPNDYVTTVWAGDVARQGYKSKQQYNHYSFLATLESFWGLSPLTQNDASATKMSEFFNPATLSTTNAGPSEVVQGGISYNTITATFESMPQSNLTVSFSCNRGLPAY